MDYTSIEDPELSQSKSILASPVVVTINTNPAIHTNPVSNQTTFKEDLREIEIKEDNIKIQNFNPPDTYNEFLKKHQNMMMCDQFEKERQQRPIWEKSQIKTFKDM